MPPPRALFDTNLYLNYLLSPDPTGTAIDLALAAAASGEFQLLLPDDVLAELATVIRRKPYLVSRIGQMEFDALRQRVLLFATPVGPLGEDPPAVCRDPRDDYLIALAAIHDADFLVTRDRDLLSLEKIVGIRIVTPIAFLELLRRETETK